MLKMRIRIDSNSRESRRLLTKEAHNRNQLLRELGWTPDTDVGEWEVSKIMAVGRVLSCSDKEANNLDFDDTLKPMLDPTQEFAAFLLLNKALQTSHETWGSRIVALILCFVQHKIYVPCVDTLPFPLPPPAESYNRKTEVMHI